MPKNNNKSNSEEGGEFFVDDALLERFNEMSGGGYLIFILDERGMPSIYESYDTVSYESLVKAFARDWLEADHEVFKSEIKDAMLLDYLRTEVDEEDEDEEGN